MRRERRRATPVETDASIAELRIRAQHIGATTFREAHEVVEWLGAVQTQDYLGALWAVGLRLRQAGEAAVERALAARTILRTWPMRGTLHCGYRSGRRSFAPMAFAADCGQ